MWGRESLWRLERGEPRFQTLAKTKSRLESRSKKGSVVVDFLFLCERAAVGMSSARLCSGFVPRVPSRDTGHRGLRVKPSRATARAEATGASHDLGPAKASSSGRHGVPHSGYHRTVGVKRPFFEGWYFRVTLPETRDNVSLIYHVYDPDLRQSQRRCAGAQVCGPGGGYLFRESPNVDAFAAEAHSLQLEMQLGDGEFYEVSEDGRRHRGRLLKSTNEDTDIWPTKKHIQVVEWDFSVAPRIGYGGGIVSEESNRDGDSLQPDTTPSTRSQTSTAGWLSSLPVFEPHYQILMAHGLATGSITVDGKVTQFTNAPSYAEKNWGGAGFPSKWFWVQCNSFSGEHKGLTITATGANRGVVLLPGVREEVAGILIHLPDGSFFPFLPIPGGVDENTGKRDEAAEVVWEVQPWGEWRVSAKNSLYEVEVVACIAEEDHVPGNTTVLRAPVDDTTQGMKPSCREHFRGQIVVNMWEREGKGWGSGKRGHAVLDNVTSNVACVEVGGGAWDTPWRGTAEMKEPLSTLAGAAVDVRKVAEFVKPILGDVAPGL